MESDKKAIMEQLRSKECENLLRKLNEVSEFNFKSIKESEILSTKARFMFEKGKHNESLHELILKLNSQRVAKVPVNSEELALAYADRAKLMFHIRQYTECIKDIDRAIKLTKSNALKVELLCWKANSSVAVYAGVERSAYEKAKHFLNKIHDSNECKQKLTKLVEKTNSVLDRCELDIQEKTYKTKLSSTCNGVKLNNNEQFGIHLVATKNFIPGDIVCVEKFYAVAHNPDEYYMYCSYCLNNKWTLIPCDYCDLCMYCSEKCKTKAWNKYHKKECIIYACVTHLTKFIDISVSLGLKLFLLAYYEIGDVDLEMLITIFENLNYDIVDSSDLTNLYSNWHFVKLYRLSNVCQFDKLETLTRDSVNVLVVLTKYLNLFKDEKLMFNSIEDLIKNKNVISIGAILLRFSCIANRNAVNFVYKSLFDNYENKRGIIITPLCSVIQHSCNPNILRICSDNRKILCFSLLPIKKDSQLFDCYYKPFYSSLSKSERLKFLMDNYNFRCHCQACKENWTFDLHSSSLYTFPYSMEDIMNRLSNDEQFEAISEMIELCLFIKQSNVMITNEVMDCLGKLIAGLINRKNFSFLYIMPLLNVLEMLLRDKFGATKLYSYKKCRNNLTL